MAEADAQTADEGNGRKRGGRDREPAAHALAAGRTIKDAAEAGHVSERSVRGWLTDPVFAARVRELRAAMFGVAVGRLAELSGKAAETLGGLLDSGSEGVRRQAAVNVLELGTKLRETVDLAAEVEALRATLEGDGVGADASEPTDGVGPTAEGRRGADPDAGDGGDTGGAAE